MRRPLRASIFRGRRTTYSLRFDPTRWRLPLHKLLRNLLVLKGNNKSPWTFRESLDEFGDVAISTQLSLDVRVLGRVLGLPADAEVEKNERDRRRPIGSGW